MIKINAKYFWIFFIPFRSEPSVVHLLSFEAYLISECKKLDLYIVSMPNIPFSS